MICPFFLFLTPKFQHAIYIVWFITLNSFALYIFDRQYRNCCTMAIFEVSLCQWFSQTVALGYIICISIVIFCFVFFFSHFFWIMLKWRKFNFFDLKSNIDRGKVAEVLKVNPFNCYFCLNFYFKLIDNASLSKEFKVNDSIPLLFFFGRKRA